jgi:hypothetical protein
VKPLGESSVSEETVTSEDFCSYKQTALSNQTNNKNELNSCTSISKAQLKRIYARHLKHPVDRFYIN